MIKCKICGRDFAMLPERHYVCRDFGQKGLKEVFSAKGKMQFDAFDCPLCGCQNAVQVRMIDVKDEIDDQDNCDEEDELKED